MYFVFTLRYVIYSTIAGTFKSNILATQTYTKFYNFYNPQKPLSWAAASPVELRPWGGGRGSSKGDPWLIPDLQPPLTDT